MRIWSLLRKTLLETLRDWKVLILILTFAPFFLFLMHVYLDGSVDPFELVVTNQDLGADAANGQRIGVGADLIRRLEGLKGGEGQRVFRIRAEANLEKAKRLAESGSADLSVHIPPEFSQALSDHREKSGEVPVVITSFGNPSNPRYLTAAVWFDVEAYGFTGEYVGVEEPLEIRLETLGGGDAGLSGFDLYVPALLSLSLMMLMFSAAGALIREKDKGTLVRLRLSDTTTFEWFSAVSVTQVLIGTLGLGLSFATATALGYRSSGSLPLLVVMGIISALSIMSVGVVVAAGLRSNFDLMTIGSFPFFLLMFFSGGMLPLPEWRLFRLGSITFAVNDVLPTSHSISAFEKILNHQATWDELIFEFAAISVLTVIFFSLGSWAFSRRHMTATR